MNVHDVAVECETCCRWAWGAGMRPAYVAARWHHPTHAMEMQIVAVVPMIRLPSGKLSPISVDERQDAAHNFFCI